MRERPILFSGPMVRAILAGSKTQTRRVVKPQPDEVYERSQDTLLVWGEEARSVSVQCPYGRPGDRLWVRETWQPIWADYETPPREGLDSPEGWAIGYPATDGIQEWADMANDEELTQACRPSIHMPRWASRLTLEVTGVRVERLHSLTEEDAQAEGVSPAETTDGDLSYVLGFIDLWDGLNAKRGHPWDTNPWVWVVEFKRLEEES